MGRFVTAWRDAGVCMTDVLMDGMPDVSPALHDPDGEATATVASVAVRPVAAAPGGQPAGPAGGQAGWNADLTPGLVARLRRPVQVGARTAPGSLWLAPLAGVGHVAFREVIDNLGGCGLLFTGMCNARAVPTENPARSNAFTWRAEELERCVCQLFGADPSEMAEAARRVEAEGFFGVDINMGCSVAAIVRRGCGADLLRDEERAVRMVESVRRAVDCPVLVKFRTGWSPDPQGAVALARRFEDAGADALVFHPRVAPDRRTRPPLRHHIRLVKEAVAIPVLGNGEVFTPGDAASMLETTGCDGISLGRIALGRPWVFAAWTGLVDDNPASNPDLWRDIPLALLDALERRHADRKYAARLFKKFLLYFIANFTYGNSLRGPMLKGDDPADLRTALVDTLATLPAITRRPSALMF